MADSAEIGRLIVKISTDLSDMKKGMDDAKKQATGFSSQISTIFKGLAVGVLANEFKKLTVETLKWGQELQKVSQQTGLTATQVGSLKFAAEKSNTSIEAITASMSNLSRVMLAASEGNKEARATFEQFQIEYRNADGSLRSTSEVMLEVADRIKNTDNQALALAASQKLLGKNARETFGFFKQGSEEIKKAGEEFTKSLGNFDMDAFAKQSEELDSKWKLINLRFKIVATQLVSAMLPAMQDLADLLIQADWSKFSDFLEGMLYAVTETAKEVGKLVKWFQQMAGLMSGKTFGEVYGKGGGAQGDIMAGEDAARIAASRKRIIDQVYGGKDPGAGTTTSAGPEWAMPEVVSEADKDKKDIKQEVTDVSNALEELKKKWENVNKEIQDSLAATLQMIATGFGSAIAEVIVEGKDFGEAMKELWKDIAKTIIAEIVRIIAQLIILFAWQQLTGQTGGGGGGFAKKLFGFRDGGVIGGAVHARNGLVTGPFGESGIPAVVHPNEIISPIDKFFDLIKDTARSAQNNITINAGDRDPREIAYQVQLEIDRRQRGI